MLIEVREPSTNKLLFKFDPERDLIEIQRRGIRILPQSLYEALQELKADRVIQIALGPIYDEFLAFKEAEWKQYHRLVSQWEVDHYLTMF